MSGSLPAYQRDPYCRELETEVLESHSGDRPWVVLDDTVFYPEGGGQPSDRGWIGDRAVVDVQREGDSIRHYLERALAPGPTLIRLDWERRFDHMQQHTAQHLLTALAADRFGWETTSFHLGSDRSDVELTASEPGGEQLGQLEEAAAEVIRANQKVSWRLVTPEQYTSLQVRSRGLPDGHSGDIRLVEIEGIDLNTCGGTHISSTGQLEAIKILDWESIRGGTRLYYLAGRRVRSRLQAHENRNADLRGILGTGDEEFVSAVQTRLDQLRDAGRRIKALEGELAEAWAEVLSSSERPVVTAHFQGHELGLLQQIGRRVSNRRKDVFVFLTSELSGRNGVFLLAAGEACSLDLDSAGARIAEMLEGRGGGSGQLFQGRAENLSARGEAVSWLEELAG